MEGELTIPPAALRSRSQEVIRLWLAEKKIHCVLRIGFWEDGGSDERYAWGVVLADMIHHIANAHADRYGHDKQETIDKVRAAFEAEMDHPTSVRLGEFVGEESDGDIE